MRLPKLPGFGSSTSKEAAEESQPRPDVSTPSGMQGGVVPDIPPAPLTADLIRSIRFTISEPQGYFFDQVETFVQQAIEALEHYENADYRYRQALYDIQVELDHQSVDNQRLRNEIELFKVQGSPLVNADGSYVTESQTGTLEMLGADLHTVSEQLSASESARLYQQEEMTRLQDLTTMQEQEIAALREWGDQVIADMQTLHAHIATLEEQLVASQSATEAAVAAQSVTQDDPLMVNIVAQDAPRAVTQEQYSPVSVDLPADWDTYTDLTAQAPAQAAEQAPAQAPSSAPEAALDPTWTHGDQPQADPPTTPVTYTHPPTEAAPAYVTTPPAQHAAPAHEPTYQPPVTHTTPTEVAAPSHPVEAATPAPTYTSVPDEVPAHVDGHAQPEWESVVEAPTSTTLPVAHVHAWGTPNPAAPTHELVPEPVADTPDHLPPVDTDVSPEHSGTPHDSAPNVLHPSDPAAHLHAPTPTHHEAELIPREDGYQSESALPAPTFNDPAAVNPVAAEPVMATEPVQIDSTQIDPEQTVAETPEPLSPEYGTPQVVHQPTLVEDASTWEDVHSDHPADPAVPEAVTTPPMHPEATTDGFAYDTETPTPDPAPLPYPVDSELPDGVELPGTGEAAISYPPAAPGVPLETHGVPMAVWAPELDPVITQAIQEETPPQ